MWGAVEVKEFGARFGEKVRNKNVLCAAIKRMRSLSGRMKHEPVGPIGGLWEESRISQNSKGNAVSGSRHEQNVGTTSTALYEQKWAVEGALGVGLPAQVRGACDVCPTV